MTSFRWFKNNWPILIIFLVTFLFFWKFFLKNLVPIPADIIPGTYLPWFDMHFASSPYGIPVKNNVLSDVVSIIYPWRYLAISLMKQGIPPLWNPYILSGNVLLANFQSAPFYPLNIIYWIIPNFAKAWSIEVILQPLLAGLFMYIFLKSNKFSKIASLFGSLTWGFSGFFAVWFEYNTIVHASLYFPLILYAIQKTQENKKYYLLLSLAISLSFYAGYPQITLYELIFSGLFVLVVLPIMNIKNYFLLILAVLLGIGLSLPFLLPGYEATTQSIRLVDNVANMSHVKFALPTQVITFVAPDYFGNPTSRNYWLVGGAYENAIVFAGVPAFILFLISFFTDKKRRTRLLWFSWSTFLISVSLIFENPISVLLGNSNIFLFSASVMGRFAVITTFAIAVSDCFAIDEIIKNKYSFKSFLTPVLLIILLISIYFYLGYSTNNSVSIRNLVMPSFTLLITGCFLIMLIKIKSKKYKLLLISGLIALEVFDLYRFHDKYNSFSPSEFLYPENPVTDFLISQKPGRFESEDGQVIPSNFWLPYELYSSSGQDTVQSLRYNNLVGFINTGRFQTGNRYTKIVNYNSPLFDFLGITNIVAIKWKNAILDFNGIASYKFDNPKFEKVFDDGRSLVLKNSKAFPRIFSVGSYKLAKTDEDFAKFFKSEDLSKTVILEDTPNYPFSQVNPVITNLKFEALSISADVNSSGSTMLVITQSHFPGWKAYIDGIETRLYRADYDFVAIHVPLGTHKVIVKYEPDSFKLGLIGGSTSLFCLLSFYVYFKLKSKRK